VQNECCSLIKTIWEVDTGDTAITNSGDLRKKQGISFIIHAVGPVWKGGHHKEPELLANCVKNSLKKYEKTHKIHSISFPAISSGIFGFPKEKCAEIMINTTIEVIDKGLVMKEVRFTNLDSETVGIFVKEMEKVKKKLEKYEGNNEKPLKNPENSEKSEESSKEEKKSSKL